MSDYTITNLKRDVPDSAVAFGLTPDLEARFVQDGLEARQIGLSYQRLAPGIRHPVTHSHGDDEELYVILAGGGRALLGDDSLEIGPWDAIRVAPETVRSFEAGPDGLELLAIGPRSTGDAVQV